MIISIVTRKTGVTDRAQWEARLWEALPRIQEVLQAEPGFLGVEYLWGADGDGQMGQITHWQTLDDCQRFIRDGGAATVALLEDRALPTAPPPDGAWMRRTFEVADAG